MTSAAMGDWTLPGAVGVYQMTEDVRCRGFHQGQPCQKLLAKNLRGAVSIKCGRCGHKETYETEPRDTAD